LDIGICKRTFLPQKLNWVDLLLFSK